MKRIYQWFDARLGISDTWMPMLRHPVPRELAGPMGWWYVFGSASLTLFAMQILTGIGLALTYVPSAGQAYESLLYLNYQAALGLVLAIAALLVGLGDGRDGAGTHDASFLARQLQVSARTDVAHRRVFAALYAGDGIHRPGAAVGSRMPTGASASARRWPAACRRRGRRLSICCWAARSSAPIRSAVFSRCMCLSFPAR